jgi:hypothetical protein
MPLSVIRHPIIKHHGALAMHFALEEIALINHLLVLDLKLASPFNLVILELSHVNFEPWFKLIDTHAIFLAVIEFTFVKIAVFVLYLTFAMDKASFEMALILRAIFKINDTFAMLCIVFPFTQIHVSIRIFSETIAMEFSVQEVSLISDAAIFDKHA